MKSSVGECGVNLKLIEKMYEDMREEEFIKFLDRDSNIVSKDKAVRSRISKARSVEKNLINPFEL